MSGNVDADVNPPADEDVNPPADRAWDPDVEMQEAADETDSNVESCQHRMTRMDQTRMASLVGMRPRMVILLATWAPALTC